MRFLRLWLKSCTLYFILKQPVPGCQIYYSKSWACTSCAQGRYKVFWESFPIPCELLLSTLSSAFSDQEHFSTTWVRPLQVCHVHFRFDTFWAAFLASPMLINYFWDPRSWRFMSFRGLWALLLKPITAHSNFSALQQTVCLGHKISATRDPEDWWTPSILPFFLNTKDVHLCNWVKTKWQRARQTHHSAPWTCCVVFSL